MSPRILIALFALAPQVALSQDLRLAPPPAPDVCKNVAQPLPPRSAQPPDRGSIQVVQVIQDDCNVGDATELQSALSSHCPAIELEPGIYTRGWPFIIDYPVRIVGDVHTTELRAGLAIRSSGVAIHGIHFTPDRAAAAKFPIGNGTLGTGAIVANRLDGEDLLSGLIITDVLIEGGGRLEQGINLGSPVGARLERIEVYDVLRYGINLGGTESPRLRGADIRDVRIVGVGDPTCQERSNCTTVFDDDDIYLLCHNEYGAECQHFGAAEYGLFVASSNTRVERAHIRDASWTGIGVAGLVSADGTVTHPTRGVELVDIDIDRVGETLRPEQTGRGAGVGVYIERGTEGIVLRHSCIGSETERGANVEWDHNQPGTAGRNIAIEDSVIRSQYVGVFYDSGVSEALSISGTLFDDPQWTAVGVDPANPLGGYSFTGNVVSLQAGACELAHVPYWALESSPACLGL